MKKMYKYGIFALAVVLVAAIASILVIRKNLSRDAEVFSEVRAYRTEVSADTEILDDLVPGDPFAYPMDDELRNLISEAYDVVNAARQEQGLKPLVWSSTLEYGARVRANEIAVVFDKNHVRPNGAMWFTVEPSIVLGENIYKGYGDASKAMESWLSSSTDSENFFSSDFTTIAISVYENNKGEHYWAALFGGKK